MIISIKFCPRHCVREFRLHYNITGTGVTEMIKSVNSNGDYGKWYADLVGVGYILVWSMAKIMTAVLVM